VTKLISCCLFSLVLVVSLLLLGGCPQRISKDKAIAPKAYGTELVEVSGGNQVTGIGSDLPEPVVLQVKDKDGNPMAGALVAFHGERLRFKPGSALSDSGGQVTTFVQVAFASGDYQIVAETPKPGGGRAIIKLREIALGSEQTVGQGVHETYCIQCHDRQSIPERVSNFDNLSPAPHEFTDAAALNPISDADLINIITYGGPALKESPEMPAYGATLKPDEIKAVVAYIRALTRGAAAAQLSSRRAP